MPKNQGKFFVNNTRITLSRLSKAHFLYFFLYHARSIGGGGGGGKDFLDESAPPPHYSISFFFSHINERNITSGKF